MLWKDLLKMKRKENINEIKTLKGEISNQGSEEGKD